MADAIAIAKLGLLADLERLNIFSQNISNATTTGYRRQVPISSDLFSRLRVPVAEAYATTGTTFSSTDSGTGPLSQTKRALDIALDGEGFLQIATADGPRYTRRGDLTLDGGGKLTTASGDAVVGSSGEITLKTDRVEILPNGEIRTGPDLLGRLDIVSFADKTALEYEGNGLFRARADAVPTREAETTTVRQGFLETSNVRPVQEMVSLLETSRNFELTRNVLSAYDTMLDSAINVAGVV